MIPLQRSGTVDDNAAAFEDLDEVIEAFIAALDGGEGTKAPHVRLL